MNGLVEYDKSCFLPERIREARCAKGMSQPELAELLGVTRQAISQYEKGVTKPKTEKMQEIQEKLGFPVEYFFKDFEYHQRNTIYFRKFKTAQSKVQEMLRVRMLWLGEIFCYLKKFLDFPELNIPCKNDSERYSSDEIEQIALDLRKKWGLGLGPISDLVLLLENNGFIISKIKLNEHKIDACSTISTQDQDVRPMVLLTSDKSAVRSRFDLAHELGHIVMHSWIDDDYILNKDNYKRIEDEANRFAGAFLVPEEAMIKEARAVRAIDDYLILKKRWKVSMAALVQRCYNLDLLSESQYESLQRQMSFKRYRKKEPLDDRIAHEEPRILRKSLDILLDSGIQTADVIKENVALPIEDFSMLCNVDFSLFKPISRRPTLKVLEGGIGSR